MMVDASQSSEGDHYDHDCVNKVTTVIKFKIKILLSLQNYYHHHHHHAITNITIKCT
jgi:hypothetical protein